MAVTTCNPAIFVVDTQFSSLITANLATASDSFPLGVAKEASSEDPKRSTHDRPRQSQNPCADGHCGHRQDGPGSGHQSGEQ